MYFLQAGSAKPYGQHTYGISRAHFSFVVYGLSERRWDAYAFEENGFDEKDLIDDVYPYEGFHVDPIVGDGSVDANLPLWNPREYYLRIINAKIGVALKETEKAVEWVEHKIASNVCLRSLRPSN